MQGRIPMIVTFNLLIRTWSGEEEIVEIVFFCFHLQWLESYFVPSLVEIGSVVLEKKRKMWKVYNSGELKCNPTTVLHSIVWSTLQ